MTQSTFKWTPNARRKSHSCRTCSKGGVQAHSVSMASRIISDYGHDERISSNSYMGRHTAPPKGSSPGDVRIVRGQGFSDTDLEAVVYH
jgi:hypothetical protein